MQPAGRSAITKTPAKNWSTEELALLAKSSRWTIRMHIAGMTSTTRSSSCAAALYSWAISSTRPLMLN